MQWGFYLSLVTVLGGLLFQAGRQSRSVEVVDAALKTFRDEYRQDVKELREMIRASLSERRHWREGNT